MFTECTTLLSEKRLFHGFFNYWLGPVSKKLSTQECLKISEDVKFECASLKTNENRASLSGQVFKDVCKVGGKIVPTPYECLQNFMTLWSNIFALFKCTHHVGKFPNFKAALYSSVSGYSLTGFIKTWKEPCKGLFKEQYFIDDMSLHIIIEAACCESLSKCRCVQTFPRKRPPVDQFS